MINLVVALPCEARAIIQYYKLRSDSNGKGFKIYARDDIRIVITGIGKTCAAAGTGFLGGRSDHQQTGVSAWLNIGIAGHRDLDLGTGIRGVKITEAATNRSWYPPQIADFPGIGREILTVDQPVTDHNSVPEDVVLEMEASGYYQTAIRFSTAELVQSYKIIADNRFNPVSDIAEDTVHKQVAEHLPQIETIVNRLRNLGEQVSESRYDEKIYTDINKEWRFTVTQRNQLRDLLRQWGVLAPNACPEFGSCKSAREVLQMLRMQIEQIPVNIAKHVIP